jgi:hypothetical protein
MCRDAKRATSTRHACCGTCLLSLLTVVRRFVQGLQEILPDEEIPKEWGGTRETLFYNGKHEVELFKRIAKNNGDSVQDYNIEGLFETPSGDEKK